MHNALVISCCKFCYFFPNFNATITALIINTLVHYIPL